MASYWQCKVSPAPLAREFRLCLSLSLKQAERTLFFCASDFGVARDSSRRKCWFSEHKLRTAQWQKKVVPALSVKTVEFRDYTDNFTSRDDTG